MMGLTAGISYGSGVAILCTGRESNNCRVQKHGEVREVRTERGARGRGAGLVAFC